MPSPNNTSSVEVKGLRNAVTSEIINDAEDIVTIKVDGKEIDCIINECDGMDTKPYVGVSEFYILAKNIKKYFNSGEEIIILNLIQTKEIVYVENDVQSGQKAVVDSTDDDF